MTTPLRACPGCLHRSWLLTLPGEEPARTVAADAYGTLLAEIEAREEGWFAEKLDEADCWAICRHDEGYPSGLRDLDDVQGALIGRGDPSLIVGFEPQAAVTIVGSRRATSHGREVARDLARELASAGLVSGS